MRSPSPSRRALLAAALLGPAAPALAQGASRSFTTSDGIRLHYTDAGQGRPILLVPGWCMPAWIWEQQVAGLARGHRVIAFDPRSQGQSQIAPRGHEPGRRGRDIVELIAHLGTPRIVLVGWSLGVLDGLSAIAEHGDQRIAGLVLVDNSVGEGPAPSGAWRSRFIPNLRSRREPTVRAFVASMFRTPQRPDYLARLTEDALRVPLQASIDLLSYPRPREFWREAVHGTRRPVLYAIRPNFATQGEYLAASHPNAQVEVFETAGHALFVDEAARFNALLADFAQRRALWA
ncbi:alpha/beta fold hydrolase [Plastoroseomonas arctica]|uniref:Alpha/beta hydrolase n=1 Tax=Plastoroseomonas arctica TaxID=1509237 RepID=A0AAF1JYC0_9PROT|nr:alpha/beta hydrolase [Plastoroseomonas arctica]MBR0654803.1 alpha/beta hydrolase [Plastoroseomonas arctica]